MKLIAWRIYKTRNSATAFTGDGAKRFGGRFNSKGIPVIYTAESVALAALEMLVHLQSSRLLHHYVLRSVTFDDAIVDRLAKSDLPNNWRSSPPPRQLQQLGDSWVASARSAVLQVPSAIIPSEFNYLLNPAHLDFSRIRLGPEQPFEFDPHLLR